MSETLPNDDTGSEANLLKPNASSLNQDSQADTHGVSEVIRCTIGSPKLKTVPYGFSYVKDNNIDPEFLQDLLLVGKQVAVPYRLSYPVSIKTSCRGIKALIDATKKGAMSYRLTYVQENKTKRPTGSPTVGQKSI